MVEEKNAVCPLLLAQYYLNDGKGRAEPAKELTSIAESISDQGKSLVSASLIYSLALGSFRSMNFTGYRDYLKKSLAYLDPEENPFEYKAITEAAGVGLLPDNLSGKEKTLIEALLKSPMSKYDLIYQVYGEDTDLLRHEGRFKVLLSRVRKKISGEIVCDFDGRYKLSLKA